MTAYPMELVDQLMDGEVVALVGSDFSCGAGIPSWYEVISELAMRLDEEMPPPRWATPDHLIALLDRYEAVRGRHALIRLVKQRFSAFDREPTAAQRALAHLPISIIVSTALDNLLERALRAAGKEVEVLVNDASIAFLRSGSQVVNVIKLYGDLDQPDSLVLTSADRAGLRHKRAQVFGLLQSKLSQATALYLAWNHSDPYFQTLLAERALHLGDYVRAGYAALVDLPEPQAEVLRRQQIHIVDLPPGPSADERLAAWLAGLTSVLPSASTQESRIATPDPSLHTPGAAWALLVGVNQYSDPAIPDLNVCVDDVTAVHRLLSPHYQGNRLLTDRTPEAPTRANVLAELASVAAAAAEEDLLLLYFSGHGIAAGGEAYLLPADARRTALRQTSISMAEIREIFSESKARARIFILDACHSGADLGKAVRQMSPEFMQRVFAEARGMAVLASCEQGQESFEWPAWKQSVFTYFLLEGLAGAADREGKGFVTISDLSRHVTNGVKQWAVEHRRVQTPTLQYSGSGEIVLLPLDPQSSQP